MASAPRSRARVHFLACRASVAYAPRQARETAPHHRQRRQAMPKIKHIAISTQDVDKTAKFYMDVFGMKEIARVNSPGATGYYLSDGDLNLAILNFKNDQVAGAERAKRYSGIHDIGS